MLSGVGRVKKSGRSLVIRLPVDVVRDSTFPLEENDEVTVSIEKGYKIMVQKLSSGRNSDTHNQP